ncbi:hypothetical protein LIER_15921 [Lithospermum erythrorhizon]|uniref:Uncharacterized protein n=1 Tax=Lithospermum erythrorhizon TaxID=34254 RepID=A0AAV3Q524_LITER
MSLKLVHGHLQHKASITGKAFASPLSIPKFQSVSFFLNKNDGAKLFRISALPLRMQKGRISSSVAVQISASLSPLDLTEDNINMVLVNARDELGQLFDTSVGMSGKVELADLDGPYVKIRLSGKFWHKRSTVVARIGNYLKQNIPEILEVDIEDEKQLDDSPENF